MSLFFIRRQRRRLLSTLLDPYNAFLTRVRGGDGSKIRFAVKDNIAVKGHPLTCGSRFLQYYLADYDAFVVQEMLATQRYAFVGKTNMDEFGMGSTGENSAFGPTVNAVSKRWISGGSSSGSAVAVAAGLADLALGSDTGGSCRLPASCNDIVGFKPTRGRVCRHGLVAYASSMDCIGFLARDVQLIRDSFDLIKDRGDELDAAIAPQPVHNKTLPVVLPRAFQGDSTMTDRVLTLLAEFTPSMIDDSFEGDKLVDAYCVMACCEAMSNLARYKVDAPFMRRPFALFSEDSLFAAKQEAFRPDPAVDLGPVVRERIARGRQILVHNRQLWEDAMKLRSRLEIRQILAWPSLLHEPLKEDPRFVERQFVLPNLTGGPAISIPIGPEPWHSLHLCGPRGSDEQLLAIAARVIKQ